MQQNVVSGDEITEVTTENLPQYSANRLVLNYTETLIPEHQSWNIGNLERASTIFDVVSSLPRDPAQTLRYLLSAHRMDSNLFYPRSKRGKFIGINHQL